MIRNQMHQLVVSSRYKIYLVTDSYFIMIQKQMLSKWCIFKVQHLWLAEILVLCRKLSDHSDLSSSCNPFAANGKHCEMQYSILTCTIQPFSVNVLCNIERSTCLEDVVYIQLASLWHQINCIFLIINTGYNLF